jgi:SAM-dependent methyltransferase
MFEPVLGLLGIVDRVLVRTKSIRSLKAQAGRLKQRLVKRRHKIKETRKQFKALIQELGEDLARVQEELRSSEARDRLRIHIKKYSTIESAQSLADCYRSISMDSTRTLDLGCGANMRNPFAASDVYGVDVRGDLPQGVRQANLSNEDIPFEDDFFDFCTAFDVLEHIPRSSWTQGNERTAFIELINEIYRVLKPGGLFLHSTPAYPSKEAFQDPTHVNIITEDTFPLYFCEPVSWARNLGYGFTGRFELVDQRWVDGIWVVGVLRAIK